MQGADTLFQGQSGKPDPEQHRDNQKHPKTGTKYRIPKPLRNALQRPPVRQSRQISIPASRHSFLTSIPPGSSSCRIRQVILPTASLSSCPGSCPFFIASHLPDCSFCIYFPELPAGYRLLLHRCLCPFPKILCRILIFPDRLLLALLSILLQLFLCGGKTKPFEKDPQPWTLEICILHSCSCSCQNTSYSCSAAKSLQQNPLSAPAAVPIYNDPTFPEADDTDPPAAKHLPLWQAEFPHQHFSGLCSQLPMHSLQRISIPIGTNLEYLRSIVPALFGNADPNPHRRRAVPEESIPSRLMYQRHGQHLHFFICDQKLLLTITEASPARMPTESKTRKHRNTSPGYKIPAHRSFFPPAIPMLSTVPVLLSRRSRQPTVTATQEAGSREAFFSFTRSDDGLFFPTVSSAGSGTISTFPARI